MEADAVTFMDGLADVDETLGFLGYSGRKPTQEMLNRILALKKFLEPKLVPKTYYEVSDIVRREKSIFVFGSSIELAGKSIAEHLENSDKAAICIETLSETVDTVIEEAQKQDMSDALILDALANSAVETLRKKTEKRVSAENPLYDINWQFGIGYGDLSIKLLEPVLEKLDAQKRIGLGTNGHDIMVPLKSAAGIIGMHNRNRIA